MGLSPPQFKFKFQFIKLLLEVLFPLPLTVRVLWTDTNRSLSTITVMEHLLVLPLIHITLPVTRRVPSLPPENSLNNTIYHHKTVY